MSNCAHKTVYVKRKRVKIKGVRIYRHKLDLTSKKYNNKNRDVARERQRYDLATFYTGMQCSTLHTIRQRKSLVAFDIPLVYVQLCSLHLSLCRLMRGKRLVCVSTFNKYTNSIDILYTFCFSSPYLVVFVLIFFFFGFPRKIRKTEIHSRIIHYYYVLFFFSPVFGKKAVAEVLLVPPVTQHDANMSQVNRFFIRSVWTRIILWALSAPTPMKWLKSWFHSWYLQNGLRQNCIDEFITSSRYVHMRISFTCTHTHNQCTSGWTYLFNSSSSRKHVWVIFVHEGYAIVAYLSLSCRSIFFHSTIYVSIYGSHVFRDTHSRFFNFILSHFIQSFSPLHRD